MLQALNPVSRRSNINKLLSLFLRRSQSSFLQHVFEEVGDAEDGVGALFTIMSAVLSPSTLISLVGLRYLL